MIALTDDMDRWSASELQRIGFEPHQVEGLRRALPPVKEFARCAAVVTAERLRWGPVAPALWATFDLPFRVAERVAGMGPQVVDLVNILSAVKDTHSDRLWTRDKVSLVEAWASQSRVPADRIRAYMVAGISAAEASELEADPASRPTDAQLALLAALNTRVEQPPLLAPPPPIGPCTT